MRKTTQEITMDTLEQQTVADLVRDGHSREWAEREVSKLARLSYVGAVDTMFDKCDIWGDAR